MLRGSEVEIEVDLEALASRLLQQGTDASGEEGHEAASAATILLR